MDLKQLMENFIKNVGGTLIDNNPENGIWVIQMSDGSQWDMTIPTKVIQTN